MDYYKTLSCGLRFDKHPYLNRRLIDVMIVLYEERGTSFFLSFPTKFHNLRIFFATKVKFVENTTKYREIDKVIHCRNWLFWQVSKSGIVLHCIIC